MNIELRVKLQCHYCKKQFWRRRCHAYKNRIRYFCIRKHYDVWRKTEKTNLWNKNTASKVSIANSGKSKSLAHRIKLSLAHIGKPGMTGNKNPMWKGGITPIRTKIWRSKKYQFWRNAVFKRDNWTCVWCGVRSQKGIKVILNADHIKSFAFFPKLRFAIDNGRTLCVPCHRKTETYGGKSHKKHQY
jgi:hypothetical protein